MSRWISLHTIALVIGLTPTSFGQFGAGMAPRGSAFHNFGNAGADSRETSQVCPVKIVAADGKTTSGTLRLTTAVISCSFGVYEIKPDKVQEIRFGNGPGMNSTLTRGQMGLERSGQVVTTSGGVIDGVVLIPNWWRVETELGVLAPNSEGLKSMTFAKKADNSPPPADPSVPPPGSIGPPPATVTLPRPGEALPPPAGALPPPGV